MRWSPQAASSCVPSENALVFEGHEAVSNRPNFKYSGSGLHVVLHPPAMLKSALSPLWMGAAALQRPSPRPDRRGLTSGTLRTLSPQRGSAKHVELERWRFGAQIALLKVVATKGRDKQHRHGDLERLLQRFDALLAETVALRDRVTATLRQ